MNILDTIVAQKKKEIESCKELIPQRELCKMPLYNRPTNSLKESIIHPEKTGIIAEFKRKSPSRGTINEHAPVDKVTMGYANNGASGLSVLTDFNFFGGSVDDLLKARSVNTLPILRKEFIIDPYQVYESKAIGSDAVLLIASILKKKQAEDLAQLAHDLGLQVLMEIHEPEELEILNDHLDIVGVNNRDLKTFEVSLDHSASIGAQIPDFFVKISESGIRTSADITFLKDHGFQGFLIGESFMRTDDPVAEFASFVKSLQR